ncbi:MAG: hypothetical protein LQ342_001260 [Letrouitia transgressa]|nr:MAG: hypothetical protein LQ342_001260 [Letrouitia transgressa]
MEHLRNDYNQFSLTDLAIPLLRAPSIDGRERKFDDFIQLPKDLGWKIQEDGYTEPEKNLLTFDEMTQTWLYFEILSQVFSHLPHYQWEDFTKTDPYGPSHINTEKLPKYIEEWFDSERKSNATERKRRLIRIQQVLDKARIYVQHCTVSSHEANARWVVHGHLALSFMVLGETLTRALNMIQKRLEFRINGWSGHNSRNQGWGYSKLILQRLNKEWWCAKAIHKLKALHRGNTIGLIYLLGFTQSSSKGPDHRKCTPTECKAATFRRLSLSEPFKPKQYHHCLSESSDSEQPTCGTNSKVKGKDLAAVINKGKIPLFRFNRALRRIEIVQMSGSFDKHYAIFSHVWTDGFGAMNNKNGMSICVLEMFSEILEQVTSRRAGVKTAVPELFWIDTLAIPEKGKYEEERVKAISQMHNIYTHAKYTVVLDLSLMQVQMGSGYSNPAMKITMCKWMTRLWTLQEAVLSKNLYFRFHDRICSMEDLEQMFDDEDLELHSCLPSLTRIYHSSILGEKRREIQTQFRKSEGWKPKSDFLASVWKAAQWRSTTHPMHEFLSLATMLNLNIEFFAKPSQSNEGTDEYKRECDGRMIELLSRFAATSPCPIPPGMIFLPGPRLPEKGYGWAPRTWLSSREIDSPDPLSLPHTENTRLNASEGLEVQFPGFLLHDLGDGRDTLYMRKHFFFSADSTLLDWYRVEPAEDTKHFPIAKSLFGRDLAIIVSRLPIEDLKETALFVLIKKTWGAIRFVEILNRVWISREERPRTLQECSEKHRKGLPEAMSAGEKLSASTVWCVDGPTETVQEEENGEGDTQSIKSNSHTNVQPMKPEDPEGPEPGNFLRRARTATSTFLNDLQGSYRKKVSQKTKKEPPKT